MIGIEIIVSTQAATSSQRRQAESSSKAWDQARTSALRSG
jgi:hypothetical protein